MARRYPPQIERELTFRPGIPVRLRVDVCKRASLCRMCENTIVRGSRRFVVWTSLPEGMKPVSGKGGKFYKREFFYHPQCFSNWLLPEDRTFSNELVCFECGLPMQTRVNRVYAGKYRSNKYLCGPCVKLPTWRFCRHCEMYAHRYDTSPILEGDQKTGHFACDHCVDENDITTVKTRKRERREGREGTSSRPPRPAPDPVVPF